jgi:Zn-dependent protease with chaperone function
MYLRPLPFYNNIFAIFASLMCLGLALFARPKLGKLPEDIAKRDEFPTLYQLTDTISEALSTSKVDAIVLTHEFNASFSEVGFRRKKILSLGVPLISALDSDELVALISHELAHGINGDPQRQSYFGTAIHTLMNWYLVIHPGVLFHPDSGIMDILVLPFNLCKLLLAYMIQWTALLLVNLLWRESQRAEYLADFLASSVSGTKGALGTLEKIQLSSAYRTTTHQIALGKPDADFFVDFAQRLTTFPELERERIKRLERLQSSRLDTTHPPTVFRIDFLNAHFVETGKVSLSSPDFDTINKELSRVHKSIQKQLVSAYKSSLYY